MRVGVVGAGTMGAGIAEVFARTPGFDVVLSDTTVELAEKGVARISKGLDKLIAKEKLDEDGKAAILGRLRTGVVADLADYPIPGDHWDGIVSIFCHIQPDLRVDLHRRSVRGLRPGGVFVLEAYTPAQLRYRTGGPPHEAMLMTLAGLRRELAGLDFVHAVECEREVVEGRLHHGLGAVVQVVAIRP